MNKLAIKRFNETIEKYELRKNWRDGVHTVTEEDRSAREECFYQKALDDFTRMMISEKNDHSLMYERWATKVSLGIAPTRAQYKASLKLQNWI